MAKGSLVSGSVWLLLHLLEGGAEKGDSGRLGQVHAWLPPPHSLLRGVVWCGYYVAVETLANSLAGTVDHWISSHPPTQALLEAHPHLFESLTMTPEALLGKLPHLFASLKHPSSSVGTISSSLCQSGSEVLQDLVTAGFVDSVIVFSWLASPQDMAEYLEYKILGGQSLSCIWICVGFFLLVYVNLIFLHFKIL